MTLLTKKEFAALAALHEGRCVSIYLPTHQAGYEVNEHQDSILFKNQLAAVEKEMMELGFGRKETEEFLYPAKALLSDPVFWRNQTAGLAVFIGRATMRYFNLPMPVQACTYVSHEYYLKPLIPVFMGNGNFYLLTLNFQDVKFYRGNRDQLAEVPLPVVLPQRREEVVGFDYEPKVLGVHSGSGKGVAAIFHGHADWQEDVKEELVRFFRDVDQKIAPVIQGENAPLVIASLDYVFPLYREANTYAHLFKEPVVINPESLKLNDLHRKVWEKMAFYFDQEREQKAALFSQFLDSARTSTDIHEIVPASLGGLVDTLFLDESQDFWGVYDSLSGEVRLHEAQSRSNTSLANLAAVKVFLSGGQVYLQEQAFMPGPWSAVNALYRY